VPIIHGAAAPVFTAPSVRFTGLASPSRGSNETCVWRLAVDPGCEPAEHSFDQEEVLIGTSGRAVASLGGVAHEIAAGDAVIVPARMAFSLANPYSDVFEAVVALPVGALARMADGETFVPPPAN